MKAMLLPLMHGSTGRSPGLNEVKVPVPPGMRVALVSAHGAQGDDGSDGIGNKGGRGQESKDRWNRDSKGTPGSI